MLPLLWESDMAAFEISIETEAAYASWKSGTMDVFIPPLPIDDEVHIVSKIPSLWSIPNEVEQTDSKCHPQCWLGMAPVHIWNTLSVDFWHWRLFDLDQRRC